MCAFLPVARALQRRSFIFIQGRRRRRASSEEKEIACTPFLGIFLLLSHILKNGRVYSKKRRRNDEKRGTMKDGDKVDPSVEIEMISWSLRVFYYDDYYFILCIWRYHSFQACICTRWTFRQTALGKPSLPCQNWIENDGRGTQSE